MAVPDKKKQDVAVQIHFVIAGILHDVKKAGETHPRGLNWVAKLTSLLASLALIVIMSLVVQLSTTYIIVSSNFLFQALPVK